MSGLVNKVKDKLHNSGNDVNDTKTTGDNRMTPQMGQGMTDTIAGSVDNDPGRVDARKAETEVDKQATGGSHPATLQEPELRQG